MKEQIKELFSKMTRQEINEVINEVFNQQQLFNTDITLIKHKYVLYLNTNYKISKN